jgi:hypothetical protein
MFRVILFDRAIASPFSAGLVYTAARNFTLRLACSFSEATIETPQTT